MWTFSEENWCSVQEEVSQALIWMFFLKFNLKVIYFLFFFNLRRRWMSNKILFGVFFSRRTKCHHLLCLDEKWKFLIFWRQKEPDRESGVPENCTHVCLIFIIITSRCRDAITVGKLWSNYSITLFHPGPVIFVYLYLNCSSSKMHMNQPKCIFGGVFSVSTLKQTYWKVTKATDFCFFFF